jgi:exonuclease III
VTSTHSLQRQTTTPNLWALVDHTKHIMSTLHTSDDESSKRQKTWHGEDEGENDEGSPQTQHHARHPRTFVTWNCNGLTTRSTMNVADLERLLQETSIPDMICMQEVRLEAIGPIGRQRGIPKNDARNLGAVQGALTNVFGAYKPFWSLADKKYAGTLALIHQRCLGRGDEDFAAFTPISAIDLILRRLGKTRQDCGLSSPSSKKMQQTSLASFFAPKKSNTSSPRNDTSKSLVNNRDEHHEEGRFQFFFFPDMDVVHTYVPNNGTDEKSFQRRRKWDEDLLQFWKDRQQVLETCSAASGILSKDRKLLWCGDMNVAREYRDGTHWERRDRGIYEWWTDESRCFVGGGVCNGKSKEPDNRGMPGFTPAERSRFNEMLQQADFCDVWRHLHPTGVLTSTNDSTSKNSTTTTTKNPWDLPNYTWRGAVAKSSTGVPAMYQGKGQRIDYFLLTPQESFSLKSCEILGYGEGEEGLFCGSDHCAVSLKI